jgi:hypothetical protein
MTRTSETEKEFAKLTPAHRRITPPVLHEGLEWQTLEIQVELHSMQALLTVLANVASLGCTIGRLAAANNLVDLELRAPAHVAHRVETCLARVIDVRSVAARHCAIG